MTEGSFEGVEGVKNFTREWQPAGEPRGVVVISHGYAAGGGTIQSRIVGQQFVHDLMEGYCA